MSPPRALLAALLVFQLLSYGGHQGLTKIFYTLPDTGQPPLLISLADNAKLDLKSPDELLFVNDSEQHNDTKTFIIVEKNALDDQNDKTKHEEKESTEPRLVVKAIPMHEVRQTEDAFQAAVPVTEESSVESQTEEQTEERQNIPVKPETPQEDIPSFSEWAQKQLAEAEKKDTVLNQSSQPSHSNTNFSNKSTKLRSKNYASPACGAKIVAVNPEAGSASSILSPNRDEYMLNTCNSRIWFVVELCEAVQAQKIEIANFELFSSIPKDIAVYFSDRFPTRDWASVGHFTAKEMRDVQSFDLYPHLFGKFIKVEMLSHHGSEHYCPISLFKVYGTSEFEVLEKESSQHAALIDDDEDDDVIDIPDVPIVETEPSKNLFGSARDAVMSIMKKAAQALVKTEVPKNVSSEHNDTSSIENMYKRCCSPSHIIVCDNCSETLYNEVYELISCSSDKLVSLVRQVFLRETLKCTGLCQPYGLDFKSTKTIEFSDERVAYMNALFPKKYLAALCNILAIKEKKVVLNTSFETELNSTSNITVEESPQKVSSETNAEQDVKLMLDKNNGSSEDKTTETDQQEEKAVITEQIENIINSEELPKEGNDKIDDKKVEPVPVLEEKLVEQTAEVIIDTNKPADTNLEAENKDAILKIDGKNGKVETTTEKPKEVANNGGDEMNDQIMIDNENFMSELDQMAVDPTPVASQKENQAQTTFQKESVFLRLSNRVKTLERNMSLSGQYLEELSRRYKKQVEEMQKTFEKTVAQMTEERRKSNEREQKYLEQMATLHDQMQNMASAVKLLLDERDSWFGNITFFKFIILQTLIIAAALYYIKTSHKPQPVLVPVPKKSRKKNDKFRRKSVEGVSGHETPSAKKRRPSEEALQIARQSVECEDDDEGEWKVARKNRRRKTSIIHRNAEDRNWSRQDSIGKLQENPIPLDEEEFYAPVPEPKEFNDTVVIKKELPKTNGSFFNNLKNKTMKTRRLSSPAFLRTFSRQSTRSTPSPVVRTLEPIFNGKVDKKAASESPTGSLWSESTEISQNGNPDNESGGKKKKSLKNILKKVF
ncbi:SUN domain-containing ossification factor isoform X2 [Amyelois transitella]|uniref:SUN domain-containing ossification factor isoform X2 n=1 Tax=Amyelois transitella TaxID=680683 RepID=UPI00067BEE46|nr:SUN domain-containing ossification factor isoform X2 [Amyelois transitella]XP_013192974.1 SUN domain-containing ossification factor isoform X2 [Amyelois transitella]XP_060803268.1 SUN domain-containing ossification factor isoform X2 [Amyelois transitella]XP_060803274.1 SUN domain-containing ossification factor isoform X2 [Amyelois transitella]